MENEVDIIVLDEVDEMVRNPGFFKQIKLICSICTKARVFAFTATPSDEALKFVVASSQIASATGCRRCR
jgi:superfamily II DNA/RNA helicase